MDTDPKLFDAAASGFKGVDGTPLVSGTLYAYLEGTTTPADLWSEFTMTTAAPWPVTLDSRGCATVYGFGNYKFVVRNSEGAIIKTFDNVHLGYEAPPAGTVWSAVATIDTGNTVQDLLEVGPYVYACTASANPFPMSPGRIYRAAKTDLTAWTECTYSAGTVAFRALCKLTDSLLVAVDTDGYLWKCTNGTAWTRFAAASTGGNWVTGYLARVSDTVVLYIPHSALLCTFAQTKAYLINVVTEVVVSSRNWSTFGAGFVLMWNCSLYNNGVAIHAVPSDGQTDIYTDSAVTAAGFSGTAFTKVYTCAAHSGYSFAPFAYRNGQYVTFMDNGLMVSDDGVTWTAVSIPSFTPGTIVILSRYLPNVVQLGMDSSARVYRTTDAWATKTLVLSAGGTYSPNRVIELADHSLLLGAGGWGAGTPNIYYSVV